MNVNWQQVIASALANTALLAILAFLGRKAIESWLDRTLESYKSRLRKIESEHHAKFQLLHEKRAAAITELYSLLVDLIRSVNLSAKGIHQYSDDDVSMPRQTRVAMSVSFYNEAVNKLRKFRQYFEDSRIYFSDQLISKVENLLSEFNNLFEELETSLSPNPPEVEPPPSIAAIWHAQKRLRLLIPPLREELETEFRRILGVLDEVGEQNYPANNSLEATWDVPRFVCDGGYLLIWKPRVGEIPGASARGRQQAFSNRIFIVSSGMLRWNESEDAVEVNSVEHLLQLLDSISKSAAPDKPIIATLHIHNYTVGIGLGLNQSFVHIESEGGDPLYWITSGDLDDDGVIDFFFHGVHHTEISKSNLIEYKKAREVIGEFFLSGERPEDVSWVQV